MRDVPGQQPESLAGSLLVAHPGMLDPNFRRTVLFLSAHSAADGALGVILNRPLGKQLSELVEQAPAAGLEKVPVFFGGPVQRDRLMFAALDWENGLKLNHSVAIEEANERLEKNPGSIRAFVGYAGWTAGQLEAEMKGNSWVVQKATRSAMKIDQLPKLWFDIMRSLGPWFKMLAAAPDDPSLN
ncbi:MAG: YqgE/AlgH family protein [Verrucomicrobia bacterium]|nr:YqgE/AlgH family protein [Verrucomicrobiota bacterium]